MKNVNTKGLSDQQKSHIAKIMKEIVIHKFGGSQSRMAERLGLTQPYISDIIHMRRGCGAKSLMMLADLLRCDIGDILSMRMTPEMVASGAKPARPHAPPPKSELERAVAFLRDGLLPDDYLDEVLETNNWGNGQYDREILVMLLKRGYDKWVTGQETVADVK